MEKEKTTQFLMRPKNDFCFKQLMADAQIRQAFLSAVTGIPYEEIEETTLLPTSLEKQYKEDKLGILDVRIQLKNSGSSRCGDAGGSVRVLGRENFILSVKNVYGTDS